MTLFGLSPRKRTEVPDPAPPLAPGRVQAPGLPEFEVTAHLDVEEGLPYLDWDAVRDWMAPLGDDATWSEAWGACERAWLLHLRDALGPAFRLDEGPQMLLLSSLEPRAAAGSLEFMARTRKRVQHVLAGLARASPWGNDILVVFDDEETYYRYVSRFYPERGEFAFSGGMRIGEGCTHMITTKAELGRLEPVVAHEMTHEYLGHLPLPLWLNEGLAVNTEHRLTGARVPIYTPQEMQAKHRAFWNDETIQAFWSGESFRRTDDGNMLSYDLARVLVEQMTGDWERFAQFACSADWHDGGAAAAKQELGIDLGIAVAAMLEREEGTAWAPDASRWKQSETRTE